MATPSVPQIRNWSIPSYKPRRAIFRYNELWKLAPKQFNEFFWRMTETGIIFQKQTTSIKKRMSNCRVCWCENLNWFLRTCELISIVYSWWLHVKKHLKKNDDKTNMTKSAKKWSKWCNSEKWYLHPFLLISFSFTFFSFQTKKPIFS